MEVIGNLITHLQRWFVRYEKEMAYAEARVRRQPTLAEIEWNVAMIGDLRRRSPDA